MEYNRSYHQYSRPMSGIDSTRLPFNCWTHVPKIWKAYFEDGRWQCENLRGQVFTRTMKGTWQYKNIYGELQDISKSDKHHPLLEQHYGLYYNKEHNLQPFSYTEYDYLTEDEGSTEHLDMEMETSCVDRNTEISPQNSIVESMSQSESENISVNSVNSLSETVLKLGTECLSVKSSKSRPVRIAKKILKVRIPKTRSKKAAKVKQIGHQIDVQVGDKIKQVDESDQNDDQDQVGDKMKQVVKDDCHQIDVQGQVGDKMKQVDKDECDQVDTQDEIDDTSNYLKVEEEIVAVSSNSADSCTLSVDGDNLQDVEVGELEQSVKNRSDCNDDLQGKKILVDRKDLMNSATLRESNCFVILTDLKEDLQNSIVTQEDEEFSFFTAYSGDTPLKCKEQSLETIEENGETPTKLSKKRERQTDSDSPTLFKAKLLKSEDTLYK